VNKGGKIMSETACENAKTCNRDQRSFKAYFSRWLAVTAQLAPYSAGTILPLLQASATGAVNVCTGDQNSGIVCGRKWYEAQDDGERDIGNQMSTLSVVQANLLQNVGAPVDKDSGTSQGNPGAGGIDNRLTSDDILATRPITTADKAGAWLVTVILFISTVGLGVFLLSPDAGSGSMFRWKRAGIV
jgi:hypothetical protein